jgi:hypothetical protein
MAFADQMAPKFTDPFKADGKLFAVPVAIEHMIPVVNMDIWTGELGLAEADLPKTYLELFDFVANWENDFGEAHGDVVLMGGFLKNNIFTIMLRNYMAYMQNKGEGLRFDTPVMRQLLDAYVRMDLPEENGDAKDWIAEAERILFDGQWGSLSMNDRQEGVRKFLYLPLTAETENMQHVDLFMMVINSKTTRLGEALTYVTHYLQNRRPGMGQIVFSPEHCESVENPDYAEIVQPLQAELEKQKALLEAAEESNKAEIRAEIQRLEGSIAEEEAWRYMVSPEDIAEYRDEVFPLLYVERRDLFLLADPSEMWKTWGKYFDGVIGQDQCLKEIDERVRMMELEAM